MMLDGLELQLFGEIRNHTKDTSDLLFADGDNRSINDPALMIGGCAMNEAFHGLPHIILDSSKRCVTSPMHITTVSI
jgi:hypothetical protein